METEAHAGRFLGQVILLVYPLYTSMYFNN